MFFWTDLMVRPHHLTGPQIPLWAADRFNPLAASQAGATENVAVCVCRAAVADEGKEEICRRLA